MVAGSNPASGAIFSSTPKLRTSSDKTDHKARNYDTFGKKYDTSPLRLYKVGKVFYYRRRYSKKLFRVSLRTRDMKEALKRKKILDMIGEENMFELATKDFKLMFEYDTEEELRTALEKFKEIQIEQAVSRYKSVKNHIETVSRSEINELTFEVLRDKYVAHKKADGRVSSESIAAYISTFKLLQSFFGKKDINELTIDDFESFKKYLIENRKISNLTINKHLKYMKNFISWANGRKFLQEDLSKPITLLDENKQKQERKKTVTNYTDKEIREIIDFDYEDKKMNTIFKILAYTGMRIGGLYSLTRNDIKYDEENGIHYFDITKDKSLAGIRQVPIHEDIIDEVLSMSFPLYPHPENTLEDREYEKEYTKLKKNFTRLVRRNLYKAIDSKSGKNVHTIRGTFMEKAVNLFPDKVYIVQEIVGHNKGEKNSLTIDRYAKGFNIALKAEIVNSIKY